MKRIPKYVYLIVVMALMSMFLVNSTEDTNMKETAIFKADLK
jgi:hypothetical protein